MKCEKCGHDHAANQICVQAPNANDNRPFDEKQWRKAYMRDYMRKKRERLRAAKLKGEAS